MLAGYSEKGVWQTLHLVVMALTVFAAPSMLFRRRLVALPVTSIAIALVCAYQQSIEIQSHVLRTVGFSWLQTVQPAPTEANLAYFETMQSWQTSSGGSRISMSAGGALFLPPVRLGGILHPPPCAAWTKLIPYWAHWLRPGCS